MSKDLEAEATPIYLGYEVSTKKYYFYFIKEGVPRFLVYSTYFYWGVGPTTALSLTPIPKEVEDDLTQFLSGTLQYEFRKLRRNSRSTTPFKIYRVPTQAGQEERDSISQVVDDAGTTSARRGTRIRRSNTDRVLDRSSSPGTVPSCQTNASNTEPLKQKRVRRTKQQMQEYRASLELKKL